MVFAQHIENPARLAAYAALRHAFTLSVLGNERADESYPVDQYGVPLGR